MSETKSGAQPKKYSGLRAALWPIEKYELKKVLPMSMLLFCMLYDYTSARILKDALFMTERLAGETVLPFLKMYCVLPAAILFVILYASVSAKYSKKAVFYGLTAFFASFFFLFGNVIFPLRETLHMSQETLFAYQEAYPRLSQVFSIFGFWSYSMFYVFAELWGNVGITVLFWQFANQITATNDAKRYYISFQSIGNFALLLAAQFMTSLFAGQKVLHHTSVATSCNIITGFAVFAMFLYWYVNKHVMTDSRFPMPEAVKKSKGPKPSLGESAKMVFTSKYLAYIALLVIAYGVSTNFVEVTWKGMMKEYAKTDPTMSYVGLQSSAFFWTGVMSIIIATFGKSIVQRLGWRWTALITPLGMLITGLFFFGSVLAPGLVGIFSEFFGMSAIAFGVMIGTMQQVFTKSAKYVLFDTTKEMAYIPLPEELKVQGKAAVEVFAGRAGKSSGGIIQGALIVILSTKDIFTLAPMLAILMTCIVLVWIWTVNKLSVEYTAKLKEEHDVPGHA